MAFDTKKLIKEVERRKPIWDVSSIDYNNRDLKKQCWEEITDIFSENLTHEEKRDFVASLQYKWKNIRTCYTRELKRRAGATSGSAASRKSPYVFFNDLKFLNKIPQNYDTGDEENNIDQTTQSNLSQIKKRKNIKEEPPTKSDSENHLEVDSDRLFMLSLLEDFKKIPERNKLTAKADIINVIKNAQSRIDDPFTITSNESCYSYDEEGDYAFDTLAYDHSEPGSSSSKQYFRCQATKTEIVEIQVEDNISEDSKFCL